MAAQAIFLCFPFIPLDKLTSQSMVSILSFFLRKALRRYGSPVLLLECLKDEKGI